MHTSENVISRNDTCLLWVRESFGSKIIECMDVVVASTAYRIEIHEV
ncbi:hypothetical protein [Clostridium saccharobutylicum]|nr:hypothetical protein [Clostridium saccharobutylicum]MBA2905648.1 hypothetical protein [Clostridium saccharobutylicum]MBA8790215.1 hypothetical protein [Clostridium saccharobutylicum]MBA8896826.1 hypothetical protein [Clostridium saccharobutylicum]MBA8994430.1 hypothetical protein [Clostridium saccharobutylicum]MBC2404208.1 hypothetical protein [Clostridium saccharobutylicum]